MSYRSQLSKLVLAAFATLSLVGCGDGYSGSTYGDGPNTKVEFKSGGKAYVTLMGQTMEGTYTVDGDKITLSAANDKGSNLVLTKQSDGTLDGGMMVGKLKKM